MSSQATLDTLELFEELKKSFSDEQAHTLSRALKRVEESRLDELATKGNLSETKSEIIKWVAGMFVAQTALILGAMFALLKGTAH